MNKKNKKKLWRFVVLGIALAIVYNASPLGRDSSDLQGWNWGARNFGRSGFAIYTDHKTGVEYVGKIGLLSTHLTPRIK